MYKWIVEFIKEYGDKKIIMADNFYINDFNFIEFYNGDIKTNNEKTVILINKDYVISITSENA